MGSFVYAALCRPLPLGRRDYTEKNEFLGVSVEGGGLRREGRESANLSGRTVGTKAPTAFSAVGPRR
jgi:hypothetical protein